MTQHYVTPENFEYNNKNKNLDVVQSLFKISREIAELEFLNKTNQISIQNIFEHLSVASYLIKYIANGLDQELELAQLRAAVKQQLTKPSVTQC